jgi:hypothetical protein
MNFFESLLTRKKTGGETELQQSKLNSWSAMYICIAPLGRK